MPSLLAHCDESLKLYLHLVNRHQCRFVQHSQDSLDIIYCTETVCPSIPATSLSLLTIANSLYDDGIRARVLQELIVSLDRR